jgi:hypothetical protein
LDDSPLASFTKGHIDRNLIDSAHHIPRENEAQVTVHLVQIKTMSMIACYLLISVSEFVQKSEQMKERN